MQDEDLASRRQAIGIAANDCCLLPFGMYSDKTLCGNRMSAYIVQAVCACGDAEYIRQQLAQGHGVCAYIPILERPTGDDKVSDHKWTEMQAAFTARCLKVIFEYTKAASKGGVILDVVAKVCAHVLSSHTWYTSQALTICVHYYSGRPG